MVAIRTRATQTPKNRIHESKKLNPKYLLKLDIIEGRKLERCVRRDLIRKVNKKGLN